MENTKKEKTHIGHDKNSNAYATGDQLVGKLNEAEAKLKKIFTENFLEESKELKPQVCLLFFKS